MKQLLLTFLLLAAVLLPQERAFAQTGAPPNALDKIDNLMDPATGAIRTTGGVKFITEKTLNHYAAERQAYYLSGATNLSLYENFAIANVSDGTLQVGRNFGVKRKEDLVRGLVTVAVQTNIASNLANLFSAKKLANDVGLPLSYTYFFVGPTRVGLSKKSESQAVRDERKRTLGQKRKFQYALIKQSKDQDFTSIDQATSDADTKTDAKAEAVKKAAKAFYDAELAIFEKAQPSFQTAWVRVQGFVPITNSTYQVAPNGSLDFVKQNTRKWSAGLSFGGVWERYGGGRSIFLNGSVGVARTNAIEQNTEGVQAYTQYGVPATPAPAGQLYTSGEGDKVYVGDIGEAWTYPLKAQAIYLLPSSGDSKIGLDTQLERYAGSYAKTNVLLGIPVFLKGSGETGVNVEAQVKFRDVSKRINGADRVTVGLSVALPFGSIVK